MDIGKLNIKEASNLIRENKLKPEEFLEFYRSNAKERNAEINAFLELFDDEKVRSGEFSGIPVAMKDNILIAGRTASASSKILENHVAIYDSTVTKKLKEAGATFIGRTNCDEFAMGSSTENSAYGVTKNPIDQSRVPGGSSGGAAAAVAMGGAIASLGSDTGGSIRQPASFCGLVGLKPTYGAVSRFGLIALGSSLDCIGPITRTVTDAEIIYNIIKGKDPLDSTTVDEDDYGKKDKLGKKGIVGVPRSLLKLPGIDADVIENFEKSLEKLKVLGYEIKDVELPSIAHSLAVYYIIMPAESSSNLARFDGVKYGMHAEGENLLADYMKTRGEGFGKETRRRIILGTYVLSAGYYDAYYGEALRGQKAITEEFRKAFEEVDYIATPTTPTPAFKIGEKAKDPLSMYVSDIFTVPANIAGIPAISIPSGNVDREGKSLPLGLQLMAPHMKEGWLFEAGKDFLGEK